MSKETGLSPWTPRTSLTRSRSVFSSYSPISIHFAILSLSLSGLCFSASPVHSTRRVARFISLHKKAVHIETGTNRLFARTFRSRSSEVVSHLSRYPGTLKGQNLLRERSGGIFYYSFIDLFIDLFAVTTREHVAPLFLHGYFLTPPPLLLLLDRRPKEN